MRINKERKIPSARDSVRDDIYHTKLWRVTRKLVLQRDKYLCKNCVTLTPANTVDHILPIRLGGSPFGMHNLQSLCESCHASKSSKERRK